MLVFSFPFLFLCFFPPLALARLGCLVAVVTFAWHRFQAGHWIFACFLFFSSFPLLAPGVAALLSLGCPFWRARSWVMLGFVCPVCRCNMIFFSLFHHYLESFYHAAFVLFLAAAVACAALSSRNPPAYNCSGNRISHERINQLLGPGVDSTVLGSAEVTFQVRNCNNVTDCGPWVSTSVSDFYPSKCYSGYRGESPSDLVFAKGEPKAILQVLNGEPVITVGSVYCGTQSSSLSSLGPLVLPSLCCITDAATCGYVALQYQGLQQP